LRCPARVARGHRPVQGGSVVGGAVLHGTSGEEQRADLVDPEPKGWPQGPQGGTFWGYQKQASWERFFWSKWSILDFAPGMTVPDLIREGRACLATNLATSYFIVQALSIYTIMSTPGRDSTRWCDVRDTHRQHPYCDVKSLTLHLIQNHQLMVPTSPNFPSPISCLVI